ncbi:DUF6980 family protein [Chitinimonas sp.]|uniref:DUF6980 family protein n=1 Tax=Chitinimonas sp. TaxID=1934313 RepID=UPI0039C85791
MRLTLAKIVLPQVIQSMTSTTPPQMTHCCQSMQYFADYHCPDHANPFDCPDQLIVYHAPTRSYGLIVHDGGSSTIEIRFCPWCGTHLTGSTAV